MYPPSHYVDYLEWVTTLEHVLQILIINTNVLLVAILRSILNHTPLKYMCMSKISSQIEPICLITWLSNEWPCTKQWMRFILFYFNVCPKSAILKKDKMNSDHSLIFSCLHLHFPINNFIRNILWKNICLLWASTFSYYNTSFASPTAKPIGPC